MSSFQIKPDGAELLAIVQAETDANARRVAPRIYLDAFGLRFEILPEPHEKWGAAVRGPYCAGCRRIQGQASFSDWSTAERRTATIPRRCEHCGHSFTAPESDGVALAERVASMFQAHVQELTGAVRSEEHTSELQSLRHL